MTRSPSAAAFAVATLWIVGACGKNAPQPAEPTAPAAREAASTPSAPGEERLAAAPADRTATPDLPAPAAREDVVARVGQAEITEGDVLDRLEQIVASQMGGQSLPEEQMREVRATMGPRIVEVLVDERLLDAQAADAGIEPSDEEYRQELQGEIESWLAFEGMTKEDFLARVQPVEGGSFEDFVQTEAEDDDFRRTVRHTRLLEREYPQRTAVSAQDVQESYEADVESVWTRPAMVRASHILFEVPDDPDAAAAGREEAERVLALARGEGADFAQLAMEHSAGPSGPRGGDLGFFPREGAMVEPFAKAAFELEAGQVSDLVETQFGLHIIRVTERQDGRVYALEEVAPAIRRRLEAERVAGVRPEHLEKLRSGTAIERL
jgi:peptidyl-prolyl cis-trans isomerase C